MTTSTTDASTGGEAPDKTLGVRRDNRRFVPVVQRWIRRIHLYLGLLMWPFVIFFALTALSFNHPTVGRGLRVTHASSSVVEDATGFRPWNPQDIAARVVESLNQGGTSYRLSERHGAKFDGWPIFAAPSAKGREVVIVKLGEGSATITERPHDVEGLKSPFEGRTVTLPEYQVEGLAQRLEPLFEAVGVATQGPLRAHPEVHPTVRFRMLDEAGKSWDVEYDLATAELGGSASDDRRMGLVDLFESMHTQHHYPPQDDYKLLWALFADFTALTILLWALTGLIMAWQLRRLRKVGVVVVAVGLLVAGGVMTGTAREVSFGAGSSHE